MAALFKRMGQLILDFIILSIRRKCLHAAADAEIFPELSLPAHTIMGVDKGTCQNSDL